MYEFISKSYPQLNSLVVIDRDGFDATTTVWGEARCEKEVSVCLIEIVSLELPPAFRVVGYGTALRTLHHNMALIVFLGSEERER